MSASAGLPGEEIVEPGLADLRAGRLSPEALTVLIAAPRLRALGLDVPRGFDEVGASVALYERLLPELGGGAHTRHHAMVRRVLSYADSARALADRR